MHVVLKQTFMICFPNTSGWLQVDEEVCFLWDTSCNLLRALIRNSLGFGIATLRESQQRNRVPVPGDN